MYKHFTRQNLSLQTPLWELRKSSKSSNLDNNPRWDEMQFDNECHFRNISALPTPLAKISNVSRQKCPCFVCQSSRGQVRSLSHSCLNIQRETTSRAVELIINICWEQKGRKKKKQIKAVCRRWRKLIACHPWIFVSYGRELKITCMFICLYISYYSNLWLFLQMGQMKKPDEKVSATASYQTDYGNMVIFELISVCLSLIMPQFIVSTKTVTNNHLTNWSKLQVFLFLFFALGWLNPSAKILRPYKA